MFSLVFIVSLSNAFTCSIFTWRGTLIAKSHLMIFSDLNVLIAVLDIILFGINNLLLSIVLMTVCFKFISSIVHLVFRFPKSSTKSHILNFLFKVIKNHDTMFQIIVSMANQIHRDIHAKIKDTSIHSTSNTMRIFMIKATKESILHIRFDSLFVYLSSDWISLFSIFCYAVVVIDNAVKND